MKVTILSFIGLSVADPFWKYPKAEKFIQWAEDAIPLIVENEEWNYSGIKLHNLANVVHTDIHGAKGMKVGKNWHIQAIYINSDQKYKFYCLINKIHTPRRPAMEDIHVNCEQYRF